MHRSEAAGAGIGERVIEVMKKNMGTLDRVLRVALAIGAILLGAFGIVEPPVDTILYVLAAILLVTSAIGVCPLYMPFKFSTGAK